MGCLNSKPKPNTQEREPEDKDPDKKINTGAQRTMDIFTASTSAYNPKLPPMVRPSKPPIKQAYNSKKRRGSKHAAIDNVEMSMRGMIQFKDKHGYVSVFDTRVLQKYYVKGLIGQGRCSDVFRAEHKATKQPYAIKAIDKLRALDSCEVELAVLRRVAHPNILELAEIFDCPDRVFFVIELATGGDLLDRMSERGQFDELEACHITKQLLEGLKYLHSLAIAHCDLRPENILLYHPGKDTRVIITDFGQAVECRDPEGVVLTTPLNLASPEYLAPEILARVPATCSVDLWGIGVLTFTMLSGQLPFSDSSKPNLMRKILRAQYMFQESLWDGVSTQAKNFIDRLLVVDASSRMTANQALRHAWIFATLGPQSNEMSAGNGPKTNGHAVGAGKSDKNRPESAGMFSLGDVSIHSLRLSSRNNHPMAMNSSGRNNLRSAGASSVKSQDTTDVESTIDLSTVVGAENDDNESSVVTEIVGMGVVSPRRFKSSVVSE